MTIPIPTFEQDRDAILATWRNLDAKIIVSKDSDNFIRASGFSNAVQGLYQYASWGINQFFPDTADFANLLRFGMARGVNLKPAVASTGHIRFAGTVAAAIPSGAVVQDIDGQQFVTTEPGVIGAGGLVDVPAVALVAGINGNQPDDTEVTLQSAPPGVAALATLQGMADGYDLETEAAYKDRVLDRLRHPPAGGNKHDYRRWALEVPGVTTAYVYPLRRGLGTVDIVVLTNGTPATQAVQNAVKAYIEGQNPAGGDTGVLTPSLVVVNVQADLTLAEGTLPETVVAAASVSLAIYFATLNPGDTVSRARIQACFTDVPGVTDLNLVAPAASVPTVVSPTQMQLAALGTVTAT